MTTVPLGRVRQRTPGDLLLHPAALVALVVLVVNDHFLKGSGVGVVTGKLSDVAGLVFFPLLLVALVEGGRKVLGVKSWPLSGRAFVVCVVATAVAYTAVKVSPSVADWYSHTLGVLAWLPRGTTRRVYVRADATDLLALPALAIAWGVRRRIVPQGPSGLVGGCATGFGS